MELQQQLVGVDREFQIGHKHRDKLRSAERSGKIIATISSRQALPLHCSFRVVLSVIFVGSCLLKPLLMRPVSLVWARIVESEKPVFTLIFGGVAAFGSTINEAAKHL